MLLDFTVSNFLSIDEPLSLNLVPGREQKWSKNLPYLKKYRRKVNPVAALFGANASGKSNILTALATLKKILHTPPQNGAALYYHPFLLRKGVDSEPSTYEVTFSSHGTIYEYVISYDATAIREEKLTRVNSATEHVVFSRTHSALSVDGKTVDIDSPEGTIETLLTTVPSTTPVPSYFAASSLRSKKTSERELITDITAVYYWSSRIIVIDTTMADQEITSGYPSNWASSMPTIDAGIISTEKHEVPLESIHLPSSLRAWITDSLNALESERRPPAVDAEHGGDRFIFSLVDGKIKAEKVTLVHSGTDGYTGSLPWCNESDGTKSAARLFTQFSALISNDFPVILAIDELDRSFHTELSRALINGFLRACTPESRSQLIFTTHDLMLMDPTRLRKDQMWLVEKVDGVTTLTAVSEFEGLRSDRDIRKSYLQGRLGAIPVIPPLEFSEQEA
ncbi:AAA family ATPase [Corynebacterium glucuronolyticum]